MQLVDLVEKTMQNYCLVSVVQTKITTGQLHKQLGRKALYGQEQGQRVHARTSGTHEDKPELTKTLLPISLLWETFWRHFWSPCGARHPGFSEAEVGNLARTIPINDTTFCPIIEEKENVLSLILVLSLNMSNCSSSSVIIILKIDFVFVLPSFTFRTWSQVVILLQYGHVFSAYILSHPTSTVWTPHNTFTPASTLSMVSQDM